MKRISFLLLAAAALCASPPAAPAQDAAVTERLNQMSGQIQDLIAARDAQNKRLEDLARQLAQLQSQLNQPSPTYATQDDLKQLAAKLQEVDQKRQADSDRILAELEKLRKTLSAPAPRQAPIAAPNPPAAPSQNPPPSQPDQGYNYVVQSGDTLTAIVTAYRNKGIKVTLDQVLKANPGLKPERMRVGQKIFIPAPTQ